MKRNDGAVSDETVELYRGMLEVNAAVAARPIVRGAGVDPKKVCRPGKRVKAWHRYHRGGILAAMSLKQYARHMVVNRAGADADIAKRWLASKGVRP